MKGGAGWGLLGPVGWIIAAVTAPAKRSPVAQPGVEKERQQSPPRKAVDNLAVLKVWPEIVLNGDGKAGLSTKWRDDKVQGIVRVEPKPGEVGGQAPLTVRMTDADQFPVIERVLDVSDSAEERGGVVWFFQTPCSESSYRQIRGWTLACEGVVHQSAPPTQARVAKIQHACPECGQVRVFTPQQVGHVVRCLGCGTATELKG